MDMASSEELGLVWMGDMLLHGDPNSLMLTSNVDNRHSFFPEPSQPPDELPQTAPMYVQDMNSIMFLDEMEESYAMDKLVPTTTSTAAVTNQSSPNTLPEANQQPAPAKKMKPVKHPGLKLQTPIAYCRDTDINVIPIQRDGMAVCEKCGAIGVKHAFYTRERRFCSLACARGSTDSQAEDTLAQDTDHSQASEETTTAGSNNSSGWNQGSSQSLQQSQPLTPSGPVSSTGGGGCSGNSFIPAQVLVPPPDEPLFPPDPKTLPHLVATYNWDQLLSASANFQAAPVSNFYHAPMAECWDNMTVGMKVEVENNDCDNYTNNGVPDSFWVATVLHIAGYKALLRYEGFGQNHSKDFWVNLCSSKVHPVGWCATRGKPLIPPKTIEDKYKDWKHFLVKRLTGARTLPSNFYSKVHDNLKSRFRCDLNLEVVDKNRISQVKVATIKKIVGKRLHVKYYDAEPGDNGFWAHEDSPLIHPVGWAKRVGQTLAAPPSYVDRCLKGLRDKDDATEDLFPLFNSLAYHTGFRPGMKLEAVDPLNLASICVATIMKVLNEGYLMIRIDSYDEDALSPGSDWFCYHSTSACILPPGFCEIHQLPLTPPRDSLSSREGGSNGEVVNGVVPSTTTFSWSQYLAGTNSIPAPADLFDLESPDHNFQVGQKLECADLMDPRLICVATISAIIGRLIKIHFNGWENEYDQWLDVQSCDMYPVGWAELVSHKLEGPPSNLNKISPLTKQSSGAGRKRRKGRGRGVGRRYGRIRDDHEREHAVSSDSSSTAAGDAGLLRQALMQSPGGDTVVSQNTLISDTNALSTSSVTVHTPNSQPSKPSGELLQVGQHKEVMGKVGEVPRGPDQSLPDSPSTHNFHKQSPQRSNTSSNRVIPVLSESRLDPSLVAPAEWNSSEVAQFLNVNNCATYAQSFIDKKITGSMLLELTKDEIIALTGKVGPSLKIFDLVQQLKLKVTDKQKQKRILC